MDLVSKEELPMEEKKERSKGAAETEPRDHVMSINAGKQAMTMPLRTRQGDRTKTGSGNGAKPVAADVRALIEGLNCDLAGEYQAILMYTHYSAKLTGPYRRELRALFRFDDTRPGRERPLRGKEHSNYAQTEWIPS
jgi:hypothetical protein